MHQTLFVIPSSWLDGPLLVAWIILSLLIMGFLYWRHGTTKEVLEFLPIVLFFTAIIYFVLPYIQLTGMDPADPKGDPIKLGLAIRGWGFCLLLGMLSSVALIYLRCRQMGYDFDHFLTMAFWMIICGIAGARIFYIVQKWDQFSASSFQELATKLLDVTRGGVVVYGSLAGGMVAATVFLYFSKKLDWRKTLDVIAPAMVLGLAIGRIGCLMNGCCFGGVCDSPLGIQFPAGSPPYMHQVYYGQLVGIRGEVDDKTEDFVTVESVEPGSFADKKGIVVGDRIRVYANGGPEEFRAIHELNYDLGKEKTVEIIKLDQKGVPLPLPLQNPGVNEPTIPISDLPGQSLKVHPAQIYSALNAIFMCAMLWFYYPFRRFHGEVFALLIIIYPIARFLLEAIRVDEAGQFETKLSISQWISLVLIVVGFAFWSWCRSYPDEEISDPVPA